MPPSVTTSSEARHTQWAAIGGSLGYVLLLLVTVAWAYGLADLAAGLVSTQIGPWLWWAILGGAVLGAIMGIALSRYGLVAPLGSVLVVYAVAMFQMWQVLQSPNTLLPGTPLDLYLVGWPLLLVVMLVSGLIERRVRARTSSTEGAKRE